MGTPRHLQRKPAEWKKAMAKYDRKRLGMEVLNEYIINGQGPIGIDLEKYKIRLTKHGSRPYMGLGLQIIRVGYPNLESYEKFLVGWEDNIDEPDDEFGPFNARERAKKQNWDNISFEKRMLDLMFEWRKDLEIGESKQALGGSVKRITFDEFEYNYRGRIILLRPPMKKEINWGNDMVELMGPFVGPDWNRWYIKQDGLDLRIYNRVYEDGLPCRSHYRLEKLWR